MIIDNTYFLNKSVFIPNAVAQPSLGANTPNNVYEIKSFIEDKEYQFLINALGYEQYAELKAQLNPDGTFIDGALEKWVRLVNGFENWRGLRYTVGVNKVSMIANYVYFYFLSDDFTNYSPTGIQIPDAANSVAQSPNERLKRGWNEFIKVYGGYSQNNRPYHFFDNWNGYGIRWTGSNTNGNELTLYDYLNKNGFDISFFNSYNVVNSFGL